MNKVILNVGGMTCSACSSGLEKYLNKQKGINKAEVNLVLMQAIIEYDDSLNILDLEKFIKKAGFESLGVFNDKINESPKESLKIIFIFTILAFLIMFIAMAHMFSFMPHIPRFYGILQFFLALLFLGYGYDILKNGYKNLLYKTPNMDTLVSLGVLASFIYSFFNLFLALKGNIEYYNHLYFESSAIVIYFIKLGRYIDHKSKEKTKEAIKDLVSITPQEAILKTLDGEKIVTIDEVKKGDILICRPGGRASVDGIITKGKAHFDEAFITGESMPSLKKKGDLVVAGAINFDGYIEYKAEKIGKDSAISQIVKLVSEATNSKAPIAKIADKVSGIFVPFVIIFALITFLLYLLLGYAFNDALITFVTILVVACPCSLGLATPLALVISEGVCASSGILIKKSEVLENASKIDVFVFDKTGTLTYGNLKIGDIKIFNNYSKDRLLNIVASIESKSSHPIASAFVSYAQEHHYKLQDVQNFTETSGKGVEGKIDDIKYFIGNYKMLETLGIKNNHLEDEQKLSQKGNSIIYVATKNNVIAIIGVKDKVRKDAKELIKYLNDNHKKVVMLTGDNAKTTAIVGKELGIKDIKSSLLPGEKTNVIKDYMQNHKVMMMGDGINDAPSLSTATIGVSISGATDIASNCADVILINGNLSSLKTLLIISKKTIRNIKQNLFWAFFYNVIMLLCASGIFSKWHIVISPMMGSLAMMLSSLSVTLNALRLKKEKKDV